MPGKNNEENCVEAAVSELQALFPARNKGSLYDIIWPSNMCFFLFAKMFFSFC